MRNVLMTMVFATLGVASIPAAFAQSDAIAVPDDSSAQAASAFSDAELRSFATAALAVQDIRDAYAPRIDAANGSDAQQQLMQEAGAKMTAAVEQQGLSVDRFHEILVAARNDDSVMDRINEQLNAPRQ